MTVEHKLGFYAALATSQCWKLHSIINRHSGSQFHNRVLECYFLKEDFATYDLSLNNIVLVSNYNRFGVVSAQRNGVGSLTLPLSGFHR